MKANASTRVSTATGGHDYAAKMDVSTESAKRKDPFSPVKNSPTTKRRDPATDGDTAAILNAINKLSDKVDTLGSQIQKNSIMLASMAKAVEFNAAEIKDCKTQLQSTEREVAAIMKNNTELLDRVLELERYKRRWNLRIRGVKEKEGENIREVVADLLVKISPPWAPNINYIVDSVHRLGRREENKTRQIIIQFTQRLHRDALWKMTKDSPICKELGVSFTEDLCQADRETRAALWPKIQQARAAGKRAYYRGGAGYIDGHRIT